MNAEPSVSIRFDDPDRVYAPGDVLLGEYMFNDLESELVKSVEASILWFSEGKGDEDMAVLDFRRFCADDGAPMNVDRPTRFEAKLPNSPLSYDGRIVYIRWCVRVRAILRRGRDVLGEKEFRLGDVKPPPIPKEIPPLA